MKLLRAGEVHRDRRDLVFRHGRAGGVVLLAFLAAPLVAVVALSGEPVRGVPWYVWVVASPLIAIVGLVLLVALLAAAEAVWRSFGAANWHARINGPALFFNLRSYQNAHFPDDAPSVVRFELSEIASARRVTGRWIELELRGVDTAELAAAARFERERPGPERKRLGIRGSSRFQHVTLQVTDAGRVRVLDVGAGLRRALRRQVKFAEASESDIDREHSGDLDGRLRALIARGETLAATALLRSEKGVSLSEAKKTVDELRRAA